MNRLHERDVVSRSDGDLQSELDANVKGETLIIVAERDELDKLVPISDQQRIGETNRLSFDGDTTVCAAPTVGPHNEPEYHLPKNKEHRTHYDANSFETVVLMFGKTGYMQRIRPFLDVTRIVAEGGKILSLTGLQPRQSPDHDAKWWVPNSQSCTELDEIILTRCSGYKTPNVLSIHTVTSADEQNEDATVVTSPDMEITNAY